MTQADDHRLAETIAALVRDAEPVRPLARPTVRLARWLAGAALLASGAVVLLGVRQDIASQWGAPVFAGYALLLAALTMVSAACALQLSVPGAATSRLTRLAPALVAVVWGGVLLWQIVHGNQLWDAQWAHPAHLTCPFRLTVVGLLPAVALFAMMRAAAPLDHRSAAMCAGFAAVGLGALGTQFVCADDAALHLMAWHFTPGIALVVAVTLFGRLDWRSR